MHSNTSSYSVKAPPYRLNAAFAEKTGQPNISLAEQVRNKLVHWLQDLQRMEDEGGSTITPEQVEEIQKISDDIRRLDAFMHSQKSNLAHADLSASNDQPKEKTNE